MYNFKKKFIGILGGTFDPPHEGHEFISRYAILKLNVQEVWWIVTSRNPLKSKSNSYDKRLAAVRKFLLGSKIKLVEIENKKSLYAIDTIYYLKNKFRTKNFIWLMGADNLENLHLWKEWKNFFYNIPIAIFDRPSYSLIITKSKPLYFFRKARINNNILKKSKSIPTPCWTFVRGLKNNNSSSYIRNSR